LTDAAMAGVQRAATLTHRLLAFSRQQPLEPEPIDVSRLVSNMTDLLRRTLGEHIAIETVLEGGVWQTRVDANQLENVLLNLAVNARDAMPSGGQLTLATANAPVGDGPSYVVLSVTDSGIGMDESTRGRVFEPFFTTKPPGMGTGLGMSTTADIVRAAHGTIEVRSALGRGTTFMLGFPTVDSAPGELDLRDDQSPTRGSGAIGTVLVVDDEPDVRTLVAEILRGAGYLVFVAPDGDAALALLERSPRVDLLVTDVVMPTMSGTDLAAHVEERAPGTPVLFVSGFVPAGATALRGAPLLTKPLRRADLLDAVRALVPAGD
jgi:CheY-like chemotaxis protein